jgi:hypothetical protein
VKVRVGRVTDRDHPAMEGRVTVVAAIVDVG